MAKTNIKLTEDSEMVLAEVKLKALKSKVDVSNKEKVINYALSLLGQLLK